MKYYPINEDLARLAKEMNSFYDYVPGSATQAYQRAVDRAAEMAEFQKQRVDPIHHDKIDRLLDTYARRLAENINQSNSISTRVPSILISGGGNFPVRKKEKQNRAADKNMEEWRQIRELLDKIKSTGLGGISADEPDAVTKLKAKLERLEAFQDKMKAVNAYYRKHKTLDGCPQLSAEEIEKLKAAMARSWRAQPKPYESYELSNNNSSIRQVKARIEELTLQAEMPYVGWDFDGGEVIANQDANRLQVFFDEKPSKETCSAMRHAGFRWAPSVGAWQRQLNDNAIRAADQLNCIRPMFGYRPSDLQKAAWRVESQTRTAHEAEDWANWNQMSVEERLAVDFCKLVRQRFPDSTVDGPAEREQVTELVQMLLTDGKRAADEMMLTVAGFVVGTELPHEVKSRAENLMTRLSGYKNSVKEKSENAQAEPVQKPTQENSAEWRFYIVEDLKTWADNAENRSPLEHFSTFEAAKARFVELRGESYNSEITDPGPDGHPPARLTLGLESPDGMGAADILHVRQGQNYLVTDFTRMERLRDDPAVSEILSQTAREIGFDLVRVHEQTDDRSWSLTVVPFAEWDNPYFPSATPGRFAAQYYEFQHLCYPLQRDDTLREGWIKQVVQYIQSEGAQGIENLTMAVAGLAAGLPDNTAVQEMATGLIRELDQYGKSERDTAPKQKTRHKKSQER